MFLGMNDDLRDRVREVGSEITYSLVTFLNCVSTYLCETEKLHIKISIYQRFRQVVARNKPTSFRVIYHNMTLITILIVVRI